MFHSLKQVNPLYHMLVSVFPTIQHSKGSPILRQLKENDPNFDKLWVQGNREGWAASRSCCFCPKGASDLALGWLGYFIGKNTILKDFSLRSGRFVSVAKYHVKAFFRGISCNRSIQKFDLSIDSGGEQFQWLSPFFENNHNLSQLHVTNCEFWGGVAYHLSSALRGCGKSLTSFSFINNRMGGESLFQSDQRGDEQLVQIIESLSMHTHLQKLSLKSMNIGRNECTALANLLKHSFTELHTLNLQIIESATKGCVI